MNNAPVTSTANPQGNGNLADLPLDKLIQQLNTSANDLSQSDDQSRLSQYGYNELAEKKSQSPYEIPLLFLGAYSLDD